MSDRGEAARLAEDAIALHVGVHKTGTTAVQTSLARSRDVLLEHGVRYPGTLMAHRDIASSALQRPLGWRTDGARPPDPHLWQQTVRQAQHWAGRTLISSEFLSEADDAQVDRIAAEVGTDRLHVLITLRNFGRLLPSAWQQNLKSGFQTPFPDWLRRMLFDEDEATLNTVFWRRHRHDRLVRRWARAIGAQNVTVIVVDESDRLGIFRAFEQLLGLPANTLAQHAGAVTNRSMTMPEAAFLRRLNLAVGGSSGWSAYRHGLHDGLEKGLVEGRTPPADEPRLTLPDWAADRAAQFGAGFADAIADSGVRVLGDLDVLRARASSSAVEQAEPEDVPVEAAIAAVLGVLGVAARSRPPIRSLPARVGARLRRVRRYLPARQG